MRILFYKVCIYTPLYSTYKGVYSIPFIRRNQFVFIHFYVIFESIMPSGKVHGYITIGILLLLLTVSFIWYAESPTISRREITYAAEVKVETPLYPGDFVVVNLETMKIELRNGTTTLETLDIITKGKPGSYYETIGGAHTNDYKEKSHFSSIGHVYMPWSVHIFGNFFIHGIPYYPDGTKVSSTYSGGCVRLSDNDAKKVYDFISRGTPIVLTGGFESDFIPTKIETPSVQSIDITRLMVATVSLEVLTQDNEVTNLDGNSLTTRRKLLPRLIVDGDDAVSVKLAQAVGINAFIDYMNQKAQSLGMTNTIFTSVTDPVMTTQEDAERFTKYISDYKAYLLNLSPTQTLSQ